MFIIDRIKSKPLAILFTLICIASISLLDYVTGSELSFSIFYLIPIAILAVSRNSSKRQIIIISFIAAAFWYVVDLSTNEYSHPLYPFWNAHVRLFIFISVGILVFNFREKYDQLNHANEKLNYLNDEKTKFIGMAAHDIRNPVSAIYSFSDLLLNDSKSTINEEEREIIGLVKSLSNSILKLINQLLDVSIIESGNIELNFMNQDYNTFVARQVHINQLLASKKQISIDLNFNGSKLLADFDDHHLSQVLNNLLTNAIKYSERESHIKVNVSEVDGMILTEVIDTGKGIPDDEQIQLFNYFQKTSTRPTEGESSTGLGLAIVKKIVTACNGAVDVKSTLNEGSNFYFTFPVSRSLKLADSSTLNH